MKVAIVTDTHVNPQDDGSSSVYAVHANANGRTRSVVEKVNALNVDLVVHLGDTVHRIQGQPQRAEAVARYHQIMKGLKAPLIQVPGNHDEGEKSTPWAPGHSVTPQTLATYREEFGDDHFFVDRDGYHFIVLNSQLFGLADEAERKQRDMLEEALAGGGTKFIFQHHPFFLESLGEVEHYDNLPPEVRDEYVALIVDAGVKAVFAGHVHNFFFNQIGATSFFVVPSTTFVRHDFTEFFPFVPADGAHGRNYASKLGFFVLDCDPTTPMIRWFRTNGHEDHTTASASIKASPTNLFAGDRSLLGVDLRHDWATPRPIPYTQLQDEFNRKHVRNDNFTVALAEIGICHLRVPLQDLEEDKPRNRLKDLARLGVRSLVFLYKYPTEQQARTLNDNADLMSFVECCAPLENIGEVDRATRSRLNAGLKIAFSAMGTSTGGEEAMAHYIWTGYDLSRPDTNAYIAKVAEHGFDAAVVRVERHKFDPNGVLLFADRVAEAGIHGILYARMASLNAAATMDNDVENAALVAYLTVLAYVVQPRVSIYLDTFSDHDRGYYPRTGLTDRAYDLRSAGRVVASISKLLDGESLEVVSCSPELLYVRSARALYCLIPTPDAASIESARQKLSSRPGAAQAELFDLDDLSLDGLSAYSRVDGVRSSVASPVLLRLAHA